MSYISSFLMNVARLMALSMPGRLALEVSNQTLLYSATAVISMTSQEPSHPSEGDAYIIPSSGWDGNFGNYIAYFDGEEFIVAPPRLTQIVFVRDIGNYYEFTGSAWIVIPQPPNLLPIRVISTDITVSVTDAILEINASAASRTVTYPPNLVTTGQARIIRVIKIDTSVNPVLISDGTNIVDAIVTPATAIGQIGGWREVYGNGTNIRSYGVG